MAREDYQIRLNTVHLSILLTDSTLKFKQTAGIDLMSSGVQGSHHNTERAQNLSYYSLEENRNSVLLEHLVPNYVIVFIRV